MAALDRLRPGHLCSVVTGYRDALRAHQERLNRLNVYPVPDGDTGTNMALTLESVVAELRGVDEDLPSVCKAISHGSLMGARGNSGVILSQVLRGLTDILKTADAVDGRTLAHGLTAASAAAYEAVMRPVEGTILTVVREAAEAAEEAAAREGATLVLVLEAAAVAGTDALDRTPQLLPVLAEAGVVDAGGAGFLLLLEVFLHVADGRPVPDPGADLPNLGHSVVSDTAERPKNGELRYEVMYFLEAPDEAVPAFKEAWAGVGDSIVVVGGDGVWNCHIHTDDIGAAIEAAVEVGKPRRIRVTDLVEQVDEERWVRARLEGAGGASAPAGATGVVAVGAGEGAIRILQSLGVETVVAGGQSMNPSTGELLDAVEASRAEGVVLLPNNKNVIPVAERAVDLASKPVKVVPTQSLAEGFAALMGFDAGRNVEANAQAMGEAIEEVRWGEVTWAVRDAATSAGPARAGDHLALLHHDIVAVAPGLADAACALLDKLVEAGDELVTVVEGEAATPEATGRITEWLAKHWPDVAVDVHRGDQPLAAYLFSAE